MNNNNNDDDEDDDDKKKSTTGQTKEKEPYKAKFRKKNSNS